MSFGLWTDDERKTIRDEVNWQLASVNLTTQSSVVELQQTVGELRKAVAHLRQDLSKLNAQFAATVASTTRTPITDNLQTAEQASTVVDLLSQSSSSSQQHQMAYSGGQYVSTNVGIEHHQVNDAIPYRQPNGSTSGVNESDVDNRTSSTTTAQGSPLDDLRVAEAAQHHPALSFNGEQPVPLPVTQLLSSQADASTTTIFEPTATPAHASRAIVKKARMVLNCRVECCPVTLRISSFGKSEYGPHVRSTSHNFGTVEDAHGNLTGGVLFSDVCCNGLNHKRELVPFQVRIDGTEMGTVENCLGCGLPVESDAARACTTWLRALQRLNRKYTVTTHMPQIAGQKRSGPSSDAASSGDTGDARPANYGTGDYPVCILSSIASPGGGYLVRENNAAKAVRERPSDDKVFLVADVARLQRWMPHITHHNGQQLGVDAVPVAMHGFVDRFVVALCDLPRGAEDQIDFDELHSLIMSSELVLCAGRSDGWYELRRQNELDERCVPLDMDLCTMFAGRLFDRGASNMFLATGELAECDVNETRAGASFPFAPPPPQLGDNDCVLLELLFKIEQWQRVVPQTVRGEQESELVAVVEEAVAANVVVGALIDAVCSDAAQTVRVRNSLALQVTAADGRPEIVRSSKNDARAAAVRGGYADDSFDDGGVGKKKAAVVPAPTDVATTSTRVVDQFVDAVDVMHRDDLLVDREVAAIEMPVAVNSIDTITALRDAIDRDDVVAVRKILDAGIDATIRDSSAFQFEHWTALHVAAAFSASDAVKTIVENLDLAAIDAKDRRGRTSLHVAAFFHDSMRHDRVDVCKALISAGAKADARDNSGWTPMHVAAECGALNIAHVLMDACTAGSALVNAKDNNDWTVLHSAMRQGSRDMIELLVNSGADMRAQTKDGCDVYQLANEAAATFLKGLTAAAQSPSNSDDNSD